MLLSSIRRQVDLILVLILVFLMPLRRIQTITLQIMVYVKAPTSIHRQIVVILLRSGHLCSLNQAYLRAYLMVIKSGVLGLRLRFQNLLFLPALLRRLMLTAGSCDRCIFGVL